MAEKDKLIVTKVKHKGIFDFKEVYTFLHDWFTDESYILVEKNYKETVAANGEKELEIEWESWKKVSDYFKHTIKLQMRVLKMKDVEVEVDGEKKGMNSGQFEGKFTAILEKDYENRWENNPFFKFLRTLYDRYLIPARIDQYEEKVISDTNEVISQLKAFLSLTGRS